MFGCGTASSPMIALQEHANNDSIQSKQQESIPRLYMGVVLAISIYQMNSVTTATKGSMNAPDEVESQRIMRCSDE